MVSVSNDTFSLFFDAAVPIGAYTVTVVVTIEVAVTASVGATCAVGRRPIGIFKACAPATSIANVSTLLEGSVAVWVRQ